MILDRTFHLVPVSNVLNAAATSADGSLIASAADDGMVQVWQSGSGTLTASLRGHTRQARCVAFSAAGDRLLASGAGDETVRIWNLDTKSEVVVC